MSEINGVSMESFGYILRPGAEEPTNDPIILNGSYDRLQIDWKGYPEEGRWVHITCNHQGYRGQRRYVITEEQPWHWTHVALDFPAWGLWLVTIQAGVGDTVGKDRRDIFMFDIECRGRGGAT